MKNLTRIGAVLLVVLVACLVAEAQGVVMEVLGLAGSGAMLGTVVNFASVDGSNEGAGNPPGLRQVLLMRARSIQGRWPNETIINASNVVTALPTYKDPTTTWAQYWFADGTASYDFEMGNDPSFQSCKHALELVMAGRNAELRAESKKHFNRGSVVIVEDKTGDFVVLGASDEAIYLKAAFKGGKKGNDKRGYTMKGDAEGMMWEPPVLDAALVALLPIEPLA